MADLGLDTLADAGLTIQLLGPFRCLARGASTPLPLPAGKATTLLKLLAVRRGSFVSLDAIVEALWDGDPPPAAAQNVASLVSRLRRVLGPDAITGGRAGYRFEAGAAQVDVDVAERLVAEAEAELRRGRPALAASAAAQARGALEPAGFLEDEPFAEWAEEGRRHAERLAGRARRAAWTAALALGAHAEALEVATRAVDADPLDEEAHRARVRALYLGGDAAAALAAYERLRTTLVEELGADPSPLSQAVHLAILRSEPLPPEEVRAPAPVRVQAPDLVGRDEELESLADRWSAAAGGRPGALVLAGPAGTGKSRVAAELARRARATGAAVLWSTCHEAERSLFLQPVLEALRGFLGSVAADQVRGVVGEWAGSLGELMPELRSLLAGEPYDRAAPEIEHRRALEAVAGAVRNIARSRPVLIVLDDAHHAGQSTLEAVHFLLDRLVDEPVMVLAAVASDAAERVRDMLGREVGLVPLGPLPLVAVEELARRHGAGTVDASELHARTGGNAQFVVEALRLASQGSEPALPETLTATVLERVRRAGRDVEDLLRVAAVVGLAFELDFTADVASITEEDAAQRADRALRAGLLTAAGSRFEFAGSVIRDALYETTPAPIRVSRHRRAAARLVSRPESAAAHYAAAGDWSRARELWAAAAEDAIRAFAIRDAERLLTAAVSAAGRAGEALPLARSRLRRGQVREELADYEGALEDHSAALAAAREMGDDALEAQALERLGWTAYYGRDSAAASELASRATELAESAAAAPLALPSALVLAGRVRHWAGDIDGAAEAYEAALSREADPATTASALSCLGALLEHGDRFMEARRTLDRAAAEATRSGAFRPLLRTLFFAALARGNLGDFGGALRALERKRRLLDDYDVHFYRARTDSLRSWVWREVGEPGRAHDLAEQAVAEAREVRAGSLQVEQELHALLAVAECALLADDEATAGQLLAEAEPLLSGWLPFRWRAELTFLEVRCRLVPGEAEALLDLARGRRSRKYEALALGHLGRREEAAAVAASTGSDLLVAEVGPHDQARAAFERIASGLPSELRELFVTRGRLVHRLEARR